MRRSRDRHEHWMIEAIEAGEEVTFTKPFSENETFAFHDPDGGAEADYRLRAPSRSALGSSRS